MSRLALLLVLSVAVFVCEAKIRSGAVRIGKDPAVTLRLRNPGIKAFLDAVCELSAKYAAKLPIPNADATVGGVDLKMKNVRITKFLAPEVRFRMIPTNGFAASLRIPHIGFEGPFTAARRTFVTTQHDEGRFIFNASDVIVNFTLTVGEFENGLPKVDNFECASSLGVANLNVRDCKEKFPVEVMGMAAKTIRPGYNALVCSTIKRMMNSQVNQLLAKIPNVLDFSNSLSFKYQIKPNFGKDYFETRFHGKIITEKCSPFTPAPFVEADSSNAMVVLLFSDSLFNDLLWQTHENQKLEFGISPTSQPLLYDLIRVDCEAGAAACLGNVAPDLKTKFGADALVRVQFKAAKAPAVEFLQGKATYTGALNADLFITTKNDSKEYHEATALVDVLGALQITIKDDVIFGKVTVEKTVVHIDEEHNKKWEDKISGTIKQIVEKQINGDVLLKGCPLKLPFGAGLTEPLVSFQPHTCQIHTGFSYTAVASAERK